MPKIIFIADNDSFEYHIKYSDLFYSNWDGGSREIDKLRLLEKYIKIAGLNRTPFL